MDNDQMMRLVYLGLVLVALGGWAFAEYRGRLGFAARSFLAWGMIFVGVMAGYGLWNDMRGGLMSVQSSSDESVEITRSADNHYYVTMTIAGQEITFLADTGATNIVLTKVDAARLGFDVENLAYIGSANTANGTVRTAYVSINEVQLGPFYDDSLPASVNDGDLQDSLLGMEYLGRFKIELNGAKMLLSR